LLIAEQCKNGHAFLLTEFFTQLTEKRKYREFIGSQNRLVINSIAVELGSGETVVYWRRNDVLNAECPRRLASVVYPMPLNVRDPVARNKRVKLSGHIVAVKNRDEENSKWHDGSDSE
jgi:hypothetical protein